MSQKIWFWPFFRKFCCCLVSPAFWEKFAISLLILSHGSLLTVLRSFPATSLVPHFSLFLFRLVQSLSYRLSNFRMSQCYRLGWAYLKLGSLNQNTMTIIFTTLSITRENDQFSMHLHLPRFRRRIEFILALVVKPVSSLHNPWPQEDERLVHKVGLP